LDKPLTDFSESIGAYVRERLIAALGLTPEGRLPSIEDQIDRMFAEANRGCGQSFDVFVERFSGMVDRAFPPGSHNREQAIAMSEGCYRTPAELQQAQDEMAEMGYCSHGIDPDCCPCGCGDHD